MPSPVTCASVALVVMLLTTVTNSLRPIERRSLPLEQLLLLSGAAFLNLLLCILYSWWNRPKPAPAPRVLVVGCGAVGSVVGFHLARGGAQVAFLVREERARELDGLRLERLGLCSCSEGSAAMIKQVEWVGFDVLTNVSDCCGPVRLRSDSPNQEAKPFDAVIMAVSAASSRAAAPALKQLVQGLGRSCAVVRVVSELGEDRFFHSALAVHHSALVDLGIGFVSYPQPLEDCGKSIASKSFAYTTTSPMLLSSSPSSAGGNATAHPIVMRLADCLNNGELPCRCVHSVGAALAVPSAALLGLVINLEYAGWKFAALRNDAFRCNLFSQSLGEAIDIATSDNEGHRQSHAQRCCRCRARFLRVLLTSSCTLRVALWFATCTHCSFLTRNAIFPFEVELFLRQHFSKPGVGAQTRVFLDAYIVAAQERKLASVALRTLAAGLPRLPPLRGSTRPSGSSSWPAAASERADLPGAGKRKLRIGKSGSMPGAAVETEGARGSPGEDRQLNQPGSLARGCPVVLVGLKGATHHNGKSGTVDAFLEAKSRYVVTLSGTGEKLALKLENLAMQT